MLFQKSRRRNSKINARIWLVFKLFWDFIHVHLICKFQEHPIKTEWVTLLTKSNMLFQQSRWCNSKINVLIWPVFKLDHEFIHGHLICKFQEHPIKTEWVTLLTKSNRSFFSNQGDVILRLMIRSGQFSNFAEISSMSTLSASFRNVWSKLKELWWWQTFSHHKSMEPCGCHSKQGFHWTFLKSIPSIPVQKHAIGKE